MNKIIESKDVVLMETKDVPTKEGRFDYQQSVNHNVFVPRIADEPEEKIQNQKRKL